MNFSLTEIFICAREKKQTVLSQYYLEAQIIFIGGKLLIARQSKNFKDE
jgi:hypothetical protein